MNKKKNCYLMNKRIFNCKCAGFLVDFVSVPVVSGFTSAAALTIASAQLKGLFGLTYNAEQFLDTLIAFFSTLGKARTWDFLLGLLCIICLLALRVNVPSSWKKSSFLCTTFSYCSHEYFMSIYREGKQE